MSLLSCDKMNQTGCPVWYPARRPAGDESSTGFCA